MGDTTDGSSSAAQGAQFDVKDSKPRGFFDRLAHAFRPTSDQNEGTPSEPGSDTAVPRPSLANLRKLRVEDVMIPKAEIVAVPLDTTKEDLVQVFRESGFTRLPVFDGTLDSPIGFVNLKDVALTYGFDCDNDTFDLKGLARHLLFVPPSMPLGVLLQKMQTDRIHMALVIDEYGGTDGLLTIEDLLEQVVGEIEDEHDTEEVALWKQERSGVYLVESKAPLDEFEAEIGRALTDNDGIDEEEIDTLGGLVFMLAGHVPARGEVIRHPDGPEFEIVEADPRRVKRVRVRLKDNTSAA